MSVHVVSGVDPGTKVAAICTLRVQGLDMKVLRLESFKLQGAWSLEARLGDLEVQLSNRLAKDRPELVAVEGGYLGRNFQSADKIATARGVALGAASAVGAKTLIVSPRAARAAVAIKGRQLRRADVKKQVQEAVRRIFGIDYRDDVDEDAADAAAIAVWTAGRAWKLDHEDQER